MDATTMPSITSLVSRLQVDFPAFQFVSGADFCWSPERKTISYSKSSDDHASLLHELSHAILKHDTFTRDVQLLALEQAAWQHAKSTLSLEYDITITQDQIEDSLDTYRDWLHARSTCPNCQAIGMQGKQRLYSCLVCRTKWHTNDARVCALRRVIVTK
jgi:hypothetical protein